MSEQELSRAAKIDAIMDMLGVREDHHESIRDGLDLLSDAALERQYSHCMLVTALIERDRSAGV